MEVGGVSQVSTLFPQQTPSPAEAQQRPPATQQDKPEEQRTAPPSPGDDAPPPDDRTERPGVNVDILA
jgi:hypothetical protein